MAKPANLFQPASFTTATNSTAEVVLGSVTVPAYFLRSSYKLGLDFVVKCPSTNSTDTVAVKAKVGSLVLATVGAHDAVNNEIMAGRADALIANDLLHSAGQAGGTNVGSLTNTYLADQAVDCNADVVVSLTAQWSVASASNQAVAKSFIVTLQPLD